MNVEDIMGICFAVTMLMGVTTAMFIIIYGVINDD